MFLTQLQSTNALLDYALQTAPAVVQVGLPATLMLIVSCPRQAGEVTLAQLNLVLPVGSDATDLLASAPAAGAASISSSDGTVWVPSQLAPGVFSFRPQGSAPVLLASQGLTLTLTNLAINATVGTAQLKVLEWAATGTGTPPTPPAAPPSGQALVAVPKFPQGFELDPLNAQPINVDWNGSTTVSWAGSAAIYELQYGDRQSRLRCISI